MDIVKVEPDSWDPEPAPLEQPERLNKMKVEPEYLNDLETKDVLNIIEVEPGALEAMDKKDFVMMTTQEKEKCVLWTAELKSPAPVKRLFCTTFDNEPLTQRDLYVWMKKFEETGSVLKQHGRGKHRTSEEDIERIRAAFHKSPMKSIRRASNELQIPRSTVHKIVRTQLQLYPHKLQMVQQLRVDDHIKRRNYAMHGAPQSGQQP
uniref:uncharacterized protein isoform X1 n=2 Tax=Myxine glutinosa TaxID=7769 RepID=UPI00358DF386